MSPFIAEIVGTMLLILLGNGVVANVVLNQTKGNNSGWIVITLAWGMAVFVGVWVAGAFSGAHMNPAVTIGLAMTGTGGFTWGQVGIYLLGQVIGAAAGQTLVWLAYKDHYAATDDRDGKLATFCTAPAISNTFSNLLTEIIGTFVLVFVVLMASAKENAAEVGMGAVGAIPVGLLVLAIGLSLGGPTGYAINPVRDLVPRIMHAILPIPDKRDSDWGYSWIPVAGPMIGAAIAAGVFILVQST